MGESLLTTDISCLALVWHPTQGVEGVFAQIEQGVFVQVLREHDLLWRWALVAMTPPAKWILIGGAEGCCATMPLAQIAAEARVASMAAQFSPQAGNA